MVLLVKHRYAMSWGFAVAAVALLACTHQNGLAAVDATLAATSAAAATIEPLLLTEYEAAQRACPLTPEGDACVKQVRERWAPAWVSYRAFRAAWLAVDVAADAAHDTPPDLCPLLAAAGDMHRAVAPLGTTAARSVVAASLVLDQVRLLVPSCTQDGGVR